MQTPIDRDGRSGSCVTWVADRDLSRWFRSQSSRSRDVPYNFRRFWKTESTRPESDLTAMKHLVLLVSAILVLGSQGAAGLGRAGSRPPTQTAAGTATQTAARITLTLPQA